MQSSRIEILSSLIYHFVTPNTKVGEMEDKG